MELTLLSVPGCPNEPVLRERLDRVLPEHPDATVTARVIEDEADAVRYGMHGSPTLLVDGVDPFSGPGTAAAVSCRVTVPSEEALRETLRDAM